MSENDIIIRTHYESPLRVHIDSGTLTPSSEPINQFTRQLITLFDTPDLNSMLSYCITQEFTASCRKISHNCYTTALFTVSFTISPTHAESTLITLYYKKEIIPLFLEATPIKASYLRGILDYIEQEQLTVEKRNHCMKLSKKNSQGENHTANGKFQRQRIFLQSLSDTIFYRHPSLKYALDLLRDEKGKVNLIKRYSSTESIRQYVPLVQDAEFRALFRRPLTRSYIIASQDPGFASDIFLYRMMANNVSYISTILCIDNYTLSISKNVVSFYTSTLGTSEKSTLLTNINRLHCWPLKIMTTCQPFIQPPTITITKLQKHIMSPQM